LGLLCGLGGGSGNLLGCDRFDDTDGDGLPHVTDGETSKRGKVDEGLNAHGLRGNKVDDSGITRLDRLGVVLGGLAGTTIDLLLDLGELAGNVGGVTIQDGGVSVGDLTGVVENDDLGQEVLGGKRGVVLRV